MENRNEPSTSGEGQNYSGNFPKFSSFFLFTATTIINWYRKTLSTLAGVTSRKQKGKTTIQKYNRAYTVFGLLSTLFIREYQRQQLLAEFDRILEFSPKINITILPLISFFDQHSIAEITLIKYALFMCREGELNEIKLIVRYIPTKKISELLSIAIFSQKESIINYLLQLEIDLNVESDILSPLDCAIQAQNLYLTHQLLKRGAKPRTHIILRRSKYTTGFSTLQSKINTCPRDAIFFKICILLRAYGLCINQYDRQGRTALIKAVLVNQLETVDITLKKGADINQLDKNGKSALFYAVKMNRYCIVKYLIRYGADVFFKESDGHTLLHTVVYYGLQTEIKNSHDEMDHMWGRCQIIRLLIKNGIDVNEVIQPYNLTAIHISSHQGFASTTRTLIQLEADINIQSSQGRTVLDFVLHPESYEDMPGNFIRTKEDQSGRLNIVLERDTLDYLVQHLIKMQVTGLPVLNNFYDIASTRIHPKIMQNYAQGCETELCKLQNSFIGKFSRYQLLTMLRQKLMDTNKTRVILRKLKREQYITPYRKYAPLILARVQQVEQRRKLLESDGLVTIVQILAEHKIPDLMIEQIITYFSNEDLIKFNENNYRVTENDTSRNSSQTSIQKIEYLTIQRSLLESQCLQLPEDQCYLTVASLLQNYRSTIDLVVRLMQQNKMSIAMANRLVEMIPDGRLQTALTFTQVTLYSQIQNALYLYRQLGITPIYILTYVKPCIEIWTMQNLNNIRCDKISRESINYYRHTLPATDYVFRDKFDTLKRFALVDIELEPHGIRINGVAPDITDKSIYTSYEKLVAIHYTREVLNGWVSDYVKALMYLNIVSGKIDVVTETRVMAMKALTLVLK
ncbi:hypothetical protein KQX54_007305 [Cotesia glomerata]|uniref:Uncharacterized protein n=1 Tax=Cotesia glomerata TaxID=32391 RepID=A0AAV7I206_COTGL|nr:hypothetical protein KQX54_007305 [Cotesia glomerata]